MSVHSSPYQRVVGPNVHDLTRNALSGVGAYSCTDTRESSCSLHDKASNQSGQLLEFISQADLKRVGYGYSNVHLKRLEDQGKFPKRVYLSPNRVAWIKSEVLEHQNRCVAARMMGEGQ